MEIYAETLCPITGSDDKVTRNYCNWLEYMIVLVCTHMHRQQILLVVVQGGPKKTRPLCYIASNFRNTA